MTRLVLDPLVMRSLRVPHEPALRTRELRWTRAQLREAADSLAAALVDQSAVGGDRIATLLADDMPAVVVIHAARRLGVTLVPLNRRATASELRYQLEAAGACALVHDREHDAMARALVGPGVARHRVEALLAGSRCSPHEVLGDQVDLDAAAVIVFTSGTTGRPKGAVLTHGNLAASAHDWADLLRPRATDRWLACLPLFHVAGLAIVTRTGRWGVELEVHAGFDPAAVRAAIDEGISHVSLVPAQLEQLLAAGRRTPVPGTLRAVLLGGGPLAPELVTRARAAGYPVLTTYGMTETASGITVGGAEPATLADPSALRPLHRAELRIEPDGAPDGSGPILVRGPMVFAGYADDPAATTAAFAEGFFRTGDIGTIDADGLLRVLDRRDDLIISGGENVYPAEVEAVLMEHPAVADAAVIGRPHQRWGAVPVAAVVREAGAAAEADALRAHCRARLAAYKVPVRIIVVDELPRDGLGKLRRRELADRPDVAFALVEDLPQP